MVFLKHGNIMPLPVRTGTGFGFVNWPARGAETLPSDSGNGVNYIIFLIPVHPSSCYAWGLLGAVSRPTTFHDQFSLSENCIGFCEVQG